MWHQFAVEPYLGIVWDIGVAVGRLFMWKRVQRKGIFGAAHLRKHNAQSYALLRGTLSLAQMLQIRENDLCHLDSDLIRPT